jgi:hypothetical protein
VYTIVHVDQNWVVCEGQIGILKFDRKATALQAVHDAKELLHRNAVVPLKIFKLRKQRSLTNYKRILQSPAS